MNNAVDELQWDAECIVLMYYQYLYLGTDKDDLLDCPDSGNEANYIIYIMHLFFSFLSFISFIYTLMIMGKFSLVIFLIYPSSE